MGRIRYSRLGCLALLLSCAVPPVVSPLDSAIGWNTCPSVGTNVSRFRRDVKIAAREWGIPFNVDCDGADICVEWGSGYPPAGFVGLPLRQPCTAHVNTHTTDVILHEVGHCIGLDHSRDPWSVMKPLLPRAPNFSTDLGPINIVTRTDWNLARRLTDC